MSNTYFDKIAFLLLLLFSANLLAQDRNCDPVVMAGSELPCMIGQAPSDVVAFKYVTGSGWVQIPVQIDERILLDVSNPYDPNELAAVRAQGQECLRYSIRPVPWDVLFYADAKTWIGADTDPTFDTDDELVFMAKDIGDRRADNTTPSGIIPNSRCEITVREPLSGNAVLGYIYLFQQNGALDQAAGVDYVSYTFSYENNYLSSYTECVVDNPTINPENSLISTDSYELGFSRRWTEDVLKLKTGTDDTDILDRRQMFINKGTCNSTELRFSSSQGAHVSAIDGPVRAIRSVMGTASGPFTQMNLLATECQVDYDLFFRLHPANGFNDVYDLNAYAAGLPASEQITYHRGGSVDVVGGNGGSVSGSATAWSYYKGSKVGGLIVSFDYQTDLVIGANGNSVIAYYDDAGASTSHDCTGDTRAYGSSGFTLRTKNCFDPRFNNPNNRTDSEECARDPRFFFINRVHYFQGPNVTDAMASQYDQYAKNPLQPSSSPDELPVELLAFKATPKKDFIHLAWATASEFNNSHFELQRSNDGKTFKSIARIAGNGTILQAQQYEFQDFTARSGQRYYYRLKQIDFDDSYAYSEVLTALLEQQVDQLSVYPNPIGSDQVLTVAFYSYSNQEKLTVFDAYGRIVLTFDEISLRTGWHKVELDISALSDGIYFVKTQDGRTTFFTKQ